jgi:hypothetical protein
MMKFLHANLTGLLAILLISSTVPQTTEAQNPIPNPGFEDWSGGEPIGWNTINQSIFGTNFICVTRDQTNPQSGTSCAKIQTVTQNIILVGPVTMPGILSLGEITLDILNQTGTVTGGVPIDTRPNMLNGWFRYQPSATDSCIMGIGLSRWNGTGRDTLAYAYKTIGGQHATWEQFSIPIEYLIWEMPDTMNIMFFSSNLLTGSPVTGSTLWVDNLTLEYGPVSANSIALKKAPALRPGSDGSSLVLLNADNTAEASIFSLNGSCVRTVKPDPGQSEINLDISTLRTGIYIVRVINYDGLSTSLKFSRL